MSDAAEVPSQEVGGWGDPEPLAAFLGSLADLVAAVAWPIALVVILLFFKDAIKQLMGRLKSVSAWNVKAEVQQTLQAGEKASDLARAESAGQSDARDTVKTLRDEPHKEKSDQNDGIDASTSKILNQLLTGPYSEARNLAVSQTLVLNTWSQLEQDLHDLWDTALAARKVNASEEAKNKTVDVKGRTLLLEWSGIISKNTSLAINELGKTRDLVALRGSPIEMGQALAYAQSTEEIKTLLRRANGALRDKHGIP